MVCEKCKKEMLWSIEGSIQRWRCPVCGWDIVTTYIDKILADETEYSLYIKGVLKDDIEKIKHVAKIASVNFVTAKRMLEEKEICIMRAKAPRIKDAILKLQELSIDFVVQPSFDYMNFH